MTSLNSVYYVSSTFAMILKWEIKREQSVKWRVHLLLFCHFWILLCFSFHCEISNFYIILFKIHHKALVLAEKWLTTAWWLLWSSQQSYHISDQSDWRSITKYLVNSSQRMLTQTIDFF